LKQHAVRIALGILVLLVFLGHAARFYTIGFVTQLDNIIYDYRLKLTMPGTTDDRVVILDIDERSLAIKELGRWPWSRDQLARLMDRLFDDYGVAMIGFDVVFAEADASSGLKKLDELAKKQLRDNTGFQSVLAQIRPELDNDAQFAKALRGRPVVLGYYFNSDDNALESEALPEPVLPAGTFAGRNITFPKWKGYGGNLADFVKSSALSGHFNPLVDFDGVSRRVPMLVEYKGKYYESLSLAMARMYLGLAQAAKGGPSAAVQFPNVAPGYPPERFLAKGYTGLEWIEIGPVRIPVDETVSALIPYRGKKSSFPYVSLADVWQNKAELKEKLRGRIALVGTSAPGLLDLRSTPVGEVYPGVEIHANLIAGMLDQTIKQKPPFMLGAEVILLLIGGVALSFLVPFLSPLRATIVSVSAMVLITGLNVLIWKVGGMVLPLATALLMTAGLFVLNMAYGYFVESRSKREFTALFGQYVPPELVDKMAEDPQKYSMEPKDAELTILFSDVRGFTSISEALSPEDLREYINGYLTTMSEIIRTTYRGTLDKYIGDAIMAFWGAPVDDPDHARNGVLAAIEMQRECKVLNAKFEARGWPPLKIGVGLNSGRVRVGDMGSEVRRAYTVMGDPVNVASRLEGRTKYYGVGMLVGEVTKNLVKDVVFKEVDKIKVKGKDEALTIFEPLGLEGELDKRVHEELKLWHQTLRMYRSQQWDQVEMNLLNLQRMNPGCALYELYATRVAENRRNPLPADWNGVTVFDEK
jgi:adenylate cyclase